MEISLFAMLCAAAVAVSYGAREERACVIFSAWVIAANWLLFATCWVYPPASPAYIAYAMGLPATHKDMWAITDLACLIAIAVHCRHVWWSPMLWSPYLITLSMLTVAWANDLEYIEYYRVLDAALIIQLAVVFLLGGGGCADRLSSVWRCVRRVGSRARRLVGALA